MRNWLRNWIHHALYEEEGWPHDPLNSGIGLAILYLGFPLTVAISLIFLATGWTDLIPVWISVPLVVYSLIVAWIALDEWRSRQRSDDGGGHGWIWQIVEWFWPRRRINQAMVIVVLVAHVAGTILVYLNRFNQAGIPGARTALTVNAIIVVAVDIWLIALTIALIRWFGPAASFWGTFKFSIIAIGITNELVTIDDRLFPWVVLPVLFAAVLALPCWLAHSIWQRRSGIRSADPEALRILPPPWW